MNVERPIVIDGAFQDPRSLRDAILPEPLQSFTFGLDTFRGIRMLPGGVLHDITVQLARLVPKLELNLAFARQSPLGQREPNYIHSDAAMGDVTGILYLTLAPPAGDGTRFWEDVQTGCQRGDWSAETQARVKDTTQWRCWKMVDAEFGRLLLFPSDYIHSRAIPENYGAGDEARLTIVMFFKVWGHEQAIDE